jgi:hypothetical protein
MAGWFAAVWTASSSWRNGPVGGAEYSDALRNGEWEYATFEANGTLRTSSNLKACFECHKPKASDDFVFSLPQLLKVPR